MCLRPTDTEKEDEPSSSFADAVQQYCEVWDRKPHVMGEGKCLYTVADLAVAKRIDWSNAAFSRHRLPEGLIMQHV